MKNLLILFVLCLCVTSCEKTENDINENCSSNCTTLKGNFISLNSMPVENINVSLKYRISGGGLGGGFTRKIVNTTSDLNGNFNKSFFIKDSEVGTLAEGYFQVEIDDSNIDINKYIRTNNLMNGNSLDIGLAIYRIINRDTIIENAYYIPKKAFIKINLNNFVRQQNGDKFEVQTLYPFGPKVGINTFLNSEYSTGFSGYGNWVATNLNNQLRVFVAEGEKNIIRITKIKNGIGSTQDIPLTVPPNNTIELTYEY